MKYVILSLLTLLSLSTFAQNYDHNIEVDTEGLNTCMIIQPNYWFDHAEKKISLDNGAIINGVKQPSSVVVYGKNNEELYTDDQSTCDLTTDKKFVCTSQSKEVKVEISLVEMEVYKASAGENLSHVLGAFLGHNPRSPDLIAKGQLVSSIEGNSFKRDILCPLFIKH